jgi:hypothetical protein
MPIAPDGCLNTPVTALPTSGIPVREGKRPTVAIGYLLSLSIGFS